MHDQSKELLASNCYQMRRLPLLMKFKIIYMKKKQKSIHKRRYLVKLKQLKDGLIDKYHRNI